MRTYLNIDDYDRVNFVKELYVGLTKLELAFDLKLILGVNASFRCDNVVLYSLKEDFARVVESIFRAVTVRDFLIRNAVPLWTHKMSAGIAVADNPPTGTSFGKYRSDALATALTHSLLDGYEGISAYDKVLVELSNAGIDLKKPYLITPGSVDIYNVNSIAQQSGQLMSRRRERPGVALELPTGELIGTTLEMIRRNIAKSALRRGDRTTWIVPKASLRPSVGGADASVYSGLAGIALFCSEYWRASGDEISRDLAHRIWAEIIGRYERQEEEVRPGLLSGAVGVALVGVRLSRVFHDEAIFLQSKILLDRLLASQNRLEARNLDWLGGLAGTMAGMKVAGHIFAEEAYERFAIILAEALISQARTSARGVYWKGAQDRRRRPMLGMAHGVSGIALAMSLMDDAKLLEFAQQAFHFEDSFFSAKESAWPVFRKGEIFYQRAWCHGSPGILLCRKIANSAHIEEIYWKEIYTAAISNLVDTTMARLSMNPNLSLCHGITGNAAIIQICDGDVRRDLSPIVKHVCSVVQREIRDVETRGGSLNPSLMLGLSGIGLFLLKQIEPSTPSPFALGTPSWI